MKPPDSPEREETDKNSVNQKPKRIPSLAESQEEVARLTAGKKARAAETPPNAAEIIRAASSGDCASRCMCGISRDTAVSR